LDKSQLKNDKQNLDKADDALPEQRELSAEQEDSLERNLVWVMGTPRSGITLVASQLSVKTKIIKNIKIGIHLGTTIGPMEKQIVRNIDHFRETPQYIFSKKYDDTWTYYLRKLILNRIFAQFPDSLEKITVIKDPSSTLVADIISKCLPKCKIILLVRDGREALDFELNTYQDSNHFFYNKDTTLSANEKLLQFVEDWSNHWAKRVQVIIKTLKIHQKDLVKLLKFEDLNNDTEKTIKKLYKFIGVKISDDELEQGFKKVFGEMTKETSSNHTSLGKWKENFSQEEQVIINDIMEKNFQKWDMINKIKQN